VAFDHDRAIRLEQLDAFGERVELGAGGRRDLCESSSKRTGSDSAFGVFAGSAAR